MSHKTALMGHRKWFFVYMSRCWWRGDITRDFSTICPGVRGKRDITNNFLSICPGARGKRDITSDFFCICPALECKTRILNVNSGHNAEWIYIVLYPAWHFKGCFAQESKRGAPYAVNRIWWKEICKVHVERGAWEKFQNGDIPFKNGIS